MNRDRHVINAQSCFSGFCTLLCIVLSTVVLVGCKDKEEIVAAEPIKPVKLLSVQAGQEQLSMSLPGRVRWRSGSIAANGSSSCDIRCECRWA